MSALISPEIKKQYFDSNGNPLSGGKLYVYEAGTTTPATSYTTEDAGTPNANPIVLDTRGEMIGLFLAVGSYKFVLKDSDDATIWTKDNITTRDVGAELDSLAMTVNEINTSIVTEVSSNRIVSGASSTKSSRARYLVPIGTANQVKILATTTDLVYIVDGASNTLASDLVASGLVSPPVTNNTALVNDANLSGQATTLTLGEFGTVIPYDAAGSEITSRDGEVVGLKIVGAATEYFIGKIDNGNSWIFDVERGGFYNKDSDAIERTTFSNNDTITFMKLSYLYLGINQVMLVSYTPPFYGATQPSSPAGGDMWYDTVNHKWMRFNSTIYEDSETVYIGMCLQDENGNTVAARPADFYTETSDLNTIESYAPDSTSLISKSKDNLISVYGNLIKYQNNYISTNIVSNIETDEVEAASTFYYRYVKEDSDHVLSSIAPHDSRGSLKGYYHPNEAWRCVSKVYNDSSSDFLLTSVQNESDFGRSAIKVISASAGPGENNIIYVDASSGPVTLTIPSAIGSSLKRYIIRKTDVTTNILTLVLGSVTKLIYADTTIEIMSNGLTWDILSQKSSSWIDAGTCTIEGTTTDPTKGTTVVDKIKYKVLSENEVAVRHEYRHTVAGGAGSGDYLFKMPNGIPIDTSSVTVYDTVEGSGNWDNNNTVGTFLSGNSGAGSALGGVVVYSADYVRGFIISSGAGGVVSSAFAPMSQTTMSYTTTFTVPI